MERVPESVERVASVDLDTYLTELPTLYQVDGQILEDDNHLFYHWVSKMYPQFQQIDGVSLEDLYLKNVVEMGMSTDDFYAYCDRTEHGFPIPAPSTRAENANYLYAFQQYQAEQSLQSDTRYEQWATEHGIDTTPGAVMVFIDSEGYRNRVHTDTKNRGMIIVD